MKATLFIILCLFCFWQNGAAQKLRFTFDTAGNQIERVWICIGCPAAVQEVKPSDLASGRLDSSLQKIPVSKDLSLRVDTRQARIFLRRADSSLPALTGYWLRDSDDRTILSGKDIRSGLDLSSVPVGTYLLYLEYPNGERYEIGVRKV